MSTQYKIEYLGQTYYYTSNIADKTVDSQAYTAATISRSEIFFELDKQGFTISADVNLAPFNAIKDRKPQDSMIVSLILDSGDIYCSGEVERTTIRVANDTMRLKVNAFKKLEKAEIPTRGITMSCNFALYEGYNKTSGTAFRCPVNKTSFDTTYSDMTKWSINGSNPYQLDTTLTLTANTFKMGYAQFKDSSGNVLGQNYIISNATGSITFLSPLEIVFSDVASIVVYKGCAKNLAACGSGKFNVLKHFGGFPLAFKDGFNKFGKTKEVPVVYGTDVLVETTLIYCLDRALIDINLELQHFKQEDELAVFQSFGIGIAERLDSISALYLANAGETLISKDKRGMRNIWADTTPMTTGQSSTASGLSDVNQTFTPQDMIGELYIKGNLYSSVKFTFDGELIDDEGWGYISTFDDTNFTFYDGTQTAVNSYYNTYAESSSNENDMIYQNIAKVDFGFNAFAQSYNAAGNTAGLTRLLNYGGSALNNATQPFLGFVKKPEDTLSAIQTKIPEIVAKCSYHPQIAGSSTNAEIGTGLNKGANPANVIYDLLTTYLGIPTTEIDTASFQTVRTSLAGAASPLGLNLKIESRTKVKKVIENICGFADLILDRRRNASGAYLYYLVELKSSDSASSGEYPLGDQFNESNSKKVQLEYNGWGAIYTDLTMEYTNQALGKKAEFKFSNENARQLLGGIKNKKIDYGTEIYGTDTLKAILSREASKLTRPLSMLSLTYFQSPYYSRELFVGDVIEYKNTQYGITSYKEYRILSVSGLKEDNFERTLTAIELWRDDVFLDAPDNWIVPTEFQKGTAGGYQLVSACPEQAFPDYAAWGAFEDSSTGAVLSTKLWSKILEQNAIPFVAKYRPAIVGTIAAEYNSNLFIDNTGDLTFTLASSNDFVSNIDITEDDYWQTGGCLALLYEATNEYEFITIRKITKVGSTYYCGEVVRNYYGGWGLSTNLFGTEDNTYTTSAKIYILPYNATGMFQNVAKGAIRDGEDISGSLPAGDKYLELYYQYNYRTGASKGAPTAQVILSLDYTGGSLVTDQRKSPFPYPVDDLHLIAASSAVGSGPTYQRNIYLRFNPTLPRSPKGATALNNVKTTGWGFGGNYDDNDLPDFKIELCQADGSNAHSVILKSGELIQGMGTSYPTGNLTHGYSYSGKINQNSIFLNLYANVGYTDDESDSNFYYNGYIDVILSYNHENAQTPTTAKVYSVANGILSQAISITL